MDINYNEILNFDDVNVLVIGDVMLDRYLIGTVERQSPEANVPVILQNEMDERLGGAGNVALNLKNLGARVSLCSISGMDKHGTTIENLLDIEGINRQLFFKTNDRITTTKTRVLNEKEHLVRVDSEDTHEISENLSSDIINAIKGSHSKNAINLIIIQDYNKGLLTVSFIEKILSLAKSSKIKVAVDPKKKNFFKYKGVDLFKPNLKELFEAFGKSVRYNEAELVELSNQLFQNLHPNNLLVTLSEYGSFFKNEMGEGIEPTPHVEKPDVCGAGDAVISLASLLLLKNLQLNEITRITNTGGAQICKAPGVVALDKELLIKSLI